jgi:hypothetical protein
MKNYKPSVKGSGGWGSNFLREEAQTVYEQRGITAQQKEHTFW